MSNRKELVRLPYEMTLSFNIGQTAERLGELASVSLVEIDAICDQNFTSVKSYRTRPACTLSKHDLVNNPESGSREILGDINKLIKALQNT